MLWQKSVVPRSITTVCISSSTWCSVFFWSLKELACMSTDWQENIHAYKKKSPLNITFFPFVFGTGSHYIDQPYLELTELCLSLHWVLGLKACTIKTKLKLYYQIDLNKESGALICHEPWNITLKFSEGSFIVSMLTLKGRILAFQTHTPTELGV